MNELCHQFQMNYYIATDPYSDEYDAIWISPDHGPFLWYYEFAYGFNDYWHDNYN